MHRTVNKHQLQEYFIDISKHLNDQTMNIKMRPMNNECW